MLKELQINQFKKKMSQPLELTSMFYVLLAGLKHYFTVNILGHVVPNKLDNPSYTESGVFMGEVIPG